jgi:hypothetical protein
VKARVLAVLRCGAEPANGNTGSYFGCPREKRAVRALIKAGVAELLRIEKFSGPGHRVYLVARLPEVTK